MKKSIALLAFTLGSLPLFAQAPSPPPVTNDCNPRLGECKVEVTPSGTITTQQLTPKQPGVGAAAAGAGVMVAGTVAVHEVVKHSDTFNVMLDGNNPIHGCVLSRYKALKANHEKTAGRKVFHRLEDECRQEASNSHDAQKGTDKQ